VLDSLCDRRRHIQGKLGIIIDAQTCRIKVSVSYIDEARKMLINANITKYSVIIMAGPRLDFSLASTAVQ